MSHFINRLQALCNKDERSFLGESQYVVTTMDGRSSLTAHPRGVYRVGWK